MGVVCEKPTVGEWDGRVKEFVCRTCRVPLLSLQEFDRHEQESDR